MTAPAYKHPELRSLSEAQSERDNAPECQNCSEPLDEDDWKIGLCKDCHDEEREEMRRACQREYGGGEDDLYYGTGRGMPRG